MTDRGKNINDNIQIHAALWDIDGTLIDSEDLHYEVIADWCRGRGYILNKKDNEILLGKSMVEKWQHLSTVHDFKADAATFSLECAELYCKALDPQLARHELVSIFLQIADKQLPQACVSNGDLVVVEANLKALKLDTLIRFSISGEDVKNGKPDPEPYLLAAEKIGVNPEHCIAIEDSHVGVKSASAAGMTVIAWPGHDTSREGYEQANYFVTCKEEFPWHLLKNTQ